jgi:hypothetical protein
MCVFWGGAGTGHEFGDDLLRLLGLFTLELLNL